MDGLRSARAEQFPFPWQYVGTTFAGAPEKLNIPTTSRQEIEGLNA